MTGLWCAVSFLTTLPVPTHTFAVDALRRAGLWFPVVGLGIAYVLENIVAAQLEAGTLVLALDEWSPFFEGYYLYYPSRRQNMPVFKALTDALRHKD